MSGRQSGDAPVSGDRRGGDPSAEADLEPPADPDLDPPADRSLDPPADPEAVAREIVLRKLTAQARTRHELAETLRRRNVPADVGDRVLDRFCELGLIDDAAFAQTFVLARHRERGLARRSLALQLRQRGITGEVAEQALAQIEPDDERARAQQFATAKARSLRGLDPAVAGRRLVGQLARRGYPPGLAHAVVREVLGDRSGGSDHLESGEQ